MYFKYSLIRFIQWEVKQIKYRTSIDWAEKCGKNAQPLGYEQQINGKPR